jgi:hypothetical protein
VNWNANLTRASTGGYGAERRVVSQNIRVLDAHDIFMLDQIEWTDKIENQSAGMRTGLYV